MSELLRSGRTPWLASPLLAVAMLLTLTTLRYNLEMGDWVGTSAIVFAVVTVALVVTRVATRNRFAPTLIGAAVAVLVLVPTYARGEEGETFLLPSLDGLKALARTFANGVDFALENPSPAAADNGLVGLITAALLGMFLLVEHMSVSWRVTASAGLILLLPWAFTILSSTRVHELALITALALWVGAMALTRRESASARRNNFGGGFIATTAVVALTAVAVPTALNGTGWGWLTGLDAPEVFAGGAARLNLELDLRNSLTTNSTAPVIFYTTSGRRPDALRTYTYIDFDGAAWDRDQTEPSLRDANQGVLWPESVDGWTESEKTRIGIKVLGLAEGNLPVPTTPRSIEAEGNWTYVASLDEIVGNATNTRELQYVIVTDPVFHNAVQLRASASKEFVEGNPALDPRYLAVAPAVDIDRVKSIAEGVTATAQSRYDAALALQQYLRSNQNFTYDTAVDPTPGDAVSAFLDRRSGYCVQFATTMVVMLRSLGIPARMAVGFLPGTRRGEGEYVIAGGDAHAWPEVYFPGHGWVRFEPTPSVQTGAPPPWADPDSSVLPVDRNVLEGGEAPVGPEIPDELGPEGPGIGPTEFEPAAGFPAWAIVLIVLALAGGAGGLLFARRVQVRHQRERLGPEGAWTRLRERVGDAAWPLWLTPFEARQHVAREIQVTAGRPLGRDADAALAWLAESVSLYRYGPLGVRVSQEQLDAWVDAVIAEAEAAKAATARPRRADARSAR